MEHDVGAVVAEHLPGYRVESVTALGQGLDHAVYEVNGDLLVRLGREPSAAGVDREARLLTAVAGISPVPVPVPVFVDPVRDCLAYRKLPGVPLLDVPSLARSARAATIVAELGGLLAALHAAPADRFAALVETDDVPPVEWRREAAESFATVVRSVPPEYHASVAAFLSAPPPRGVGSASPPCGVGSVPPPRGGDDLVFSHNDLGIEHVLVDPTTARVTGVIDWSDAAITDPAYDIGLLYRDLGPVALDLVDGVSVRERAVFYARCTVFADLAYGLETGRDRYVDKSLAALAWLFR